MEKKKSVHTDEGLQGNERIEEAILALQQEPTEELLAHTLTVLRKRMQEKGQFIVAVEPPVGDGTMKLQTIRTKDGGLWWMVFTGFDEELRGSGSVMSTFMAIWDVIPVGGFCGRYPGSDRKSVEPDADDG